MTCQAAAAAAAAHREREATTLTFRATRDRYIRMFHLVLRSSASTRTATQTLSAGHAINSSMRGAVGTLSHRNFAVRKPRKGTNETEADMAKRPVYWVDPKDVMKYKADVKVARRKIIDEVEALAAEKERLNPTPIKLSIFGDDWDLKAEAAKDPLMDVYQLGHLNAFDRAKLSRVPKITTKVSVSAVVIIFIIHIRFAIFQKSLL